MNKEDILIEIEKLKDWEAWDLLEKKYFQKNSWPEKDNEMLSKDLSRPIAFLDSVKWEPLSIPYVIEPDVWFFYEKCRNMAFAILEPEAEQENQRNPQRYGSKCIYCQIWTRAHIKFCPECGSELLPIPLNED